MEVDVRKPLRGIATVQVGYVQQKSEIQVNGAFNGPLVRLVVDGQWTQADLDVTDIAKEQQTEGRDKN